MKDGPHGAEGRRADSGSICEPTACPPLPFQLVSCEPCSYGSKKGEARIEIDGFGSVDVDYFAPPGKPSFAIARSIKSRFTGAYERTTRFDDEFAEAVRGAIEERLPSSNDGSV